MKARRLLPGCLLATAALAAATLFPLSPLWIWERGAASGAVTLERSGGRLLLSPLVSTLEQWSLLTAVDHVTVFVTILACGAGIGLAQSLRRDRTYVRAACATLRGVGLAAAVTGVVIMAGSTLPWPMSRLGKSDPELVAVDFHSHTDRSHDGRTGFTLERNRAWHGHGGFDVAYVTDHADSAASVPPLKSGVIPILLAGAEFRSGGAHLVRLGAAGDPSAALILTTPFPPESLQRLRAAGTVIDGVEVADASPRGLQWLSDRRPELQLAASALGAVPIASSNLHGWGRTVAAWTLLRLPGWQHDSPERLDARIRELLRAGHPADVRVVVRRSVRSTPGRARLAVVLPLLLWTTLRTLDGPERVVWFIWIWLPPIAAMAWAFAIRWATGLSPAFRVAHASMSVPGDDVPKAA